MSRISLSPSGASRWLNCTASPGFIADNSHLIPKEEAPEYTTDGIKAHQLAAEWLLLGKVKADDFPDIEMLRFTSAYATFVKSSIDERDVLEVENKVDLFYMPGRHGYVDAAILHNQRVVVIDLKYGEGISVNAFENSQLAIYARSLIEERRGQFDFNVSTEVQIAIYQPRVFRGEKISWWKITLGELIHFTDRIAGTAKLIQDERENHDGAELLGMDHNPADYGLEFFPDDDICRFCPASAFCTAKASWLLGDLDILDELANGGELEFEEDTEEFLLGVERTEPLDPGTLPAPETLPPHVRAALVAKGPALIKWINRLQSYSMSMLATGKKDEVPGFKLIAGRPGNRYWNDEKEALRLLRQRLSAEERTITKLISPAQAEERLKGVELSTVFRNKLDAVTSKKSGSLKMVPLDNDEPEVLVTVQAELEFSNLDDAEADKVESILCDMLA